MSAANSVISNDRSIALDWADVDGANLYHVQVSLNPDFSGTPVTEDNTLAVSAKSFTDNSADDRKRYWRWRYSTDSGSTWSEWSEVGSYWLNTTALADITLSVGNWALVDPDNVGDVYTFECYPMHSKTSTSIYRSKERNRKGALFTEWYASKDIITLHFEAPSFCGHEQVRAFDRFNTEIKTFFLVKYGYNGVDYVPNIWKVVFSEDPVFEMLAPGREDFFTGTTVFEEV